AMSALAADPSPLSQVPANAPIVVQVRGIKGVKDRFNAMIKKAIPDLAGKVEEKVEEALDKALKGRQLKGLVDKGPIFVAFLELPNPGGEMPKAAIIARVSDYKAFRDGILKEDERKELKKTNEGYESAKMNDEDAFFVDRKDYAVIASTKEIAVQFTKDFESLEGKLPKDVAANLLGNDIALYVKMMGINKEYGDAIGGGKTIIELAIDQAAENSGGQLDKETVEMIKKVIGAIFQGVEDCNLFLLTLDFRPDGVALHAQAG